MNIYLQLFNQILLLVYEKAVKILRMSFFLFLFFNLPCVGRGAIMKCALERRGYRPQDRSNSFCGP